MAKLNGPRYSDNNSGQQPSKEQDQRNIAALLMEKGIPLSDFQFKRTDAKNPDNPAKMIAGIKAYGAQLLGLVTTDTTTKEGDTNITQEQDETSPQPPEKEPPEKEPFIAIPFAEFAELLAPKGINLQQQLSDHVAFMVRRGILQEQDAEAYGAKFTVMHVQKSELENIPKGYRPMLFIDNMMPVQAAQTFIQGAGIALSRASYLAEFKKVDPETGKAYKEQPSPSGVARLTFTPNVTNPTSDLTGEKADNHLEKMQKGKRYLEPAQWFQLFAEGLETAMKALNLGNEKAWKDLKTDKKQAILQDKRIDTYLPDANTWTQFPDWRNDTGYVLYLHWGSGFRKVLVSYAHPQNAYGNLGPRPVFGCFSSFLHSVEKAEFFILQTSSTHPASSQFQKQILPGVCTVSNRQFSNLSKAGSKFSRCPISR